MILKIKDKKMVKKMNREIVKNIFFIVIGAVLLGIVEFMVFQLTEIIVFIIGFVGFLALIDGIFGLYNTIRNEHKNEEVKKVPPDNND